MPHGAADQHRPTGPADPSVRVRGRFMVLFAVIYGLAELLVRADAVFQFGPMLCSRAGPTSGCWSSGGI